MTNRKSTKRALLGSVVALLLCFSMLIGTTFAWFTDTATSGSNVIQSGNLDIEVQYTLDGTTWNGIDGATDLFRKGLWEPGHTEVVALKIENKGSLALKYAVNMNMISETVGKTKDGADIILSDILTVSTLAQQANDDMGIGDITLGLAFAGEDSVAYENTSAFKAGNVLGNDKELQPGAAHYLIVKVDMAETVGNEANHNGTDIPEINFGINVLATQFTYEEDSFGNQYDKDASYPDEILTSATLYESTLESGSFVLGTDVKTSESTKHYNGNREYAIRDNKDYTLDLNGHTITHDGVYQDGKNTGYTYLYTVAYGGKLTVNGEGTIKSANSQGRASVFYAQSTGEIVINGGDVEVDKGIAVWAGNGSKVTINGGSFISTGSAGNEELIYSSGGVIDIYGGFFHNKEWENRPVNVADANRGTGFINIYGGTFVNFDPSTGGNDPGNIKVMDGYKVVSETQANGDVWYTVVAE